MAEIPENTSSLVSADFETIRRIRDLWANHDTDEEIRDVLSISKDEWKRLMTVMKEHSLPDNFVEYQKYVARTLKRVKDLERLRNTAEAYDEFNAATKCFQLEADMDKALLEMGQKLGVLKPELIQVQGEVKHNVKMAGLFGHLDLDNQEQAKQEAKNLVHELITGGFIVNDTPREHKE